MSQVTVQQAAALTGKSRETIDKATRSGKLSFTRNARNHKAIDVAELERLHPLIRTMDEINQTKGSVNYPPNTSEPDTNHQLAVYQEKLSSSETVKEMIAAERERERRQFQEELDILRKSVEKLQEHQSKALLLITEQSKQASERIGGSEQAALRLEEQLVKQKTETEAEAKKLIKNAKQEAVDEIKSMSWPRAFWTLLRS